MKPQAHRNGANGYVKLCVSATMASPSRWQKPAEIITAAQQKAVSAEEADTAPAGGCACCRKLQMRKSPSKASHN